MSNLCLYILVRNDMASMTPGRQAAQATHAANQFVKEYQTAEFVSVEQWQSEANGFGTVIVLHGKWDDIKAHVNDAASEGFATGFVVDPTYPIKDGDVYHTVSVITCAYVFGDKAALRAKTGIAWFDLMP